jgi:hypothetical protein
MKTLNILLILFLLAACGKDQETITTIEGQLMASCDVPAANTSGTIKTDDGFADDGVSLSFITDENGYFKVSHRGKEIGNFRLIAGGGEVLSVWSLPGWEKDLGKVYINPPRVNYYLKLEVNNTSYSELDTLHYRNAGYPSNVLPLWIKKAGPFSNGDLDTVLNAVNMGGLPFHFGSSNVPKIRLDYFVNVYDSNNDKFVYIPTPHCVDEFQTVTLVID